MRKYYCDSCEEETKRPNVFSVPCHLYSLKGKAGYCDMEGNSVSGRMDSIDLCNSCINKAYSSALIGLGLPNKGTQK